MAFENPGLTLTFKAASVINAGQPVRLVGAAVTPGSSADETVIPAASLNEDVIGVARGTQPTVGYPVEVVLDGVVKCYAAASLGAGARVVVGTTTGRLIPLSASGIVASVGPSAGAFSPKYQVGRALVAAVDADAFAVLLDPEQII